MPPTIHPSNANAYLVQGCGELALRAGSRALSGLAARPPHGTKSHTKGPSLNIHRTCRLCRVKGRKPQDGYISSFISDTIDTW